MSEVAHHRFGIAIWGIAAAFLLWSYGCGGDDAKPQAAEVEQIAPTSTVSAENIEKSLSAAQTYLDSQELEKAHAILMTLIDRAPRESRAHEMLGLCETMLAMQAQARGDTNATTLLRNKAYHEYQIATELSPDVAGLQQSAGQIAWQAGLPDQALEHFQTAAKLDAKNPQYPLFAAQVLIQAKRYAEAKEALGRVLAMDPNEAAAHASLAMIAVEEKQFDEAISQMRIAREIQPEDLGLRAQEAKVHRRAGNPKHGLELLIGLSDSDRAKEMVAVEIATCFDDLGEHIQAAKAWQHVFQSDPTSSRAWFAAVKTGECLMKAGEREQAQLWLQQAQIAAPNEPEVQALAKSIASS